MIRTMSKVTNCVMGRPIVLPGTMTTVVTIIQIALVACTVVEAMWDLVKGGDSQ